MFNIFFMGKAENFTAWMQYIFLGCKTDRRDVLKLAQALWPI